MPVSKAQMSYVHITGHTTFVPFCDFLENRFCGHSTFVLQSVKVYCSWANRLTDKAVSIAVRHLAKD